MAVFSLAGATTVLVRNGATAVRFSALALATRVEGAKIDNTARVVTRTVVRANSAMFGKLATSARRRRFWIDLSAVLRP